MTTIGMIGIGMMGHGIASNLLKHGQSLTVLEHPGNQPLDALLAAGARTCTTPPGLGGAIGCDHPVRDRHAAGRGGAAG